MLELFLQRRVLEEFFLIMKYLILGVSGMAGHLIAMYLKEKGHEVIGVSRRAVDFVDFISLDLSKDYAELLKLVREGDYDFIVNVAGVLNDDADCCKEHAILINSYLPHFLSRAVKESRTRVIHLSTDCVFSGKNGPYPVDAIPDGMSFYARTKSLGEICDAKNITFRTSIVGPDINQDGIGLFNWFMKQKGGVFGYSSVQWSGVTTLELARIISLIPSDFNCFGIVNLTPNVSISKHELLCLFNHFFRGDSVVVKNNSDFICNKSLIVDPSISFVNPYVIQVKMMREWVLRHMDFYSHYVDCVCSV
jgi:dTDP-4-dehydrorhamnose reductase